jgi:hypothetical protein
MDKMKRFMMLRPMLVLLSILAANAAAKNTAFAQGTLNVALQQQFAFTGCSTAANVCGTPLIGGLLYFYQVGTTATRQDSFADPGLQNVNPWPLTLDANGRVPMFYLASGSVHVRLTDATGVVQFDYPSMLVIGPSGGGGGTTYVPPPGSQAATGDVKFRLTKQVPAGWLVLNGTTIGNATSGANSASANNQALWVYLYTNCPDSVCTVPGRTANATTDFASGKQMTMPDMRSRVPVGFDDMGTTPLNFIVSANFANTAFLPGPPGVTGTTLFGHGGETIHDLTVAELPSSPGLLGATVTDSRTWGVTGLAANQTVTSGSGLVAWSTGTSQPVSVTGGSISAAITGALGNGQAHNLMPLFYLGTWLIKQ